METAQHCVARAATHEDYIYIPEIVQAIALSATRRKVSKGLRSPEYIAQKIKSGLAVISIQPQTKTWLGFAYLEVWEHQKYVAGSGLIVSPPYRGIGVAKAIKQELFSLSRTKFPEARILSLTTNPAVIHANLELGYQYVSHDHIVNDQLFQEGRHSWIDFKKLMKSEQSKKKYVAMIFDPPHHKI